MVATVVAPAVAAEVMADVAMMGKVVPFLATSVILYLHPIQGIPPLRRLFPPSLTLRLRWPLCPPPPSPAVARPQYATAIVQVQDCGDSRGASPSLRRTAGSHGPGKKEKRGDGTTKEGARKTTVSLSAALLPQEGKG